MGVLPRDLWREPGLPTRGDLRRWRHADPRFEARVRAAVNAARSLRMTTYDPNVADAICLRLCAGESLKGICRDPSMPCVATVFEWLKTQPDFVHGYNIARDMQADRLYDLGRRVWRAMTPQTAETGEHDLAHVRWNAGKVSPKRYGR